MAISDQSTHPRAILTTISCEDNYSRIHSVAAVVCKETPDSVATSQNGIGYRMNEVIRQLNKYMHPVDLLYLPKCVYIAQLESFIYSHLEFEGCIIGI